MTITNAELTWMRGVQDRAIGQGTAVIYRSTNVADGMGGFSDGFAAVGTADARLLPPSGDEKIAGEQITSITEWFLTMTVGTDVIASDRILFNSVQHFDVLWVNNDEHWRTSVRCRCKTYDGPV